MLCVGVQATTGTDAAAVASPAQNGIQTPHNVANESDTLPVVTGEITPQTPPAATTITHELTIDSQAPLPNGSGILFPPPYRAADITVAAVQTDSTGSPQLTVEETVTGQALLRVQANESIDNLRLDLRVSHPSRSNVTQKELQMLAPNASPTTETTTTLTGYTIQPIGADRRAGPTGDFDRTAGTGYVYSGATVYRGEADISFRGELTEPLRGVTGDATGVALGPPIRSDASVGTYSTDGTNTTANVTVKEPQISGFRIENERGADVSDGLVLGSTSDQIAVVAQSNFEDAENLKLTVETPDGLDVTNELIKGPRIRRETDDGEPASIQTASDVSQPSSVSYLDRTRTPARSRHLRQTKTRPDSVTTQLDSQAGVDASRTIANTNLEQGGSTTVTITATVGPAGRIGISEEFSPEVRSAELESITVNGDSVLPLVAAADETGVAVAIQDLTPGDTVTVEYTLGVEDDDQTYQITGQVTSGSQAISLEETTVVAGTGTSGTISSGGRVRWEIPLNRVETTELQITVTGSDDLESGDARIQSGVRITYEDPHLSLESASVPEGTTNTITVQNGSGGATYAVSIPASDIRPRVEGSDYYRIFRNVGTTNEVGVITTEGTYSSGTQPEGDVQAVYATLRIDPDDATGITEIRTDDLADNVSVELSQEPQSDHNGLDTAELHVTDPAVSLTEPQTYTTGTSTTVAGTTSTGIDAVALYVHTERGFELIDLSGRNGEIDGELDVSGTSFSADDVDLSAGDAPGNEVVSRPGQYRIGVKSVAALQRTTSDGSLPRQLSEPEFLSNGAAMTTLSVQNTSLTLSRVGQNQTVATTATELSVVGQATGSEQVLLVLVDARGTITTEVIEHDESRFSEEMPATSIATGKATLYAITTGRDGIVGDGHLPTKETGATLPELAEYLNNANSTTPTQAGELILSETQLDVGSDDRTAITRVQVSEPRVTITNVTTPNRTNSELRIRGHTNRRPVDAVVLVTLYQHTEAKRSAQTSTWTAGRWNASIQPDNLSSGRYTVVAEINDIEDRQTVRLNSSVATQTPTSTTGQSSTTRRPTSSATQTTRTSAPEKQSPTSPMTPTTETLSTTDATAPGFSIFLSILGIIMCSLSYLVYRRNATD